MEKNIIGTNAGIIWNYIDTNGEITITELKKATKLDIKDIYLALGWLARENNVFLNNSGKELSVSIIY